MIKMVRKKSAGLTYLSVKRTPKYLYDRAGNRWENPDYKQGFKWSIYTKKGHPKLLAARRTKRKALAYAKHYEGH